MKLLFLFIILFLGCFFFYFKPSTFRSTLQVGKERELEGVSETVMIYCFRTCFESVIVKTVRKPGEKINYFRIDSSRYDYETKATPSNNFKLHYTNGQGA